jgi:hypothetical protein
MDKRNPDGSYMSESQIIEDVIQDIKSSPFVLQQWSKLKLSEVSDLHFGAGLNIRNAYGLWKDDNPHFKSKHPDDASGDILEKVGKASTSQIESEREHRLNRNA